MHKVKEERGAAMAAAREKLQDPQPDTPSGVERADDLLPKRNEPEQPNRKGKRENLSTLIDAAAPLWRETSPSSVNR